MRTVAAPLTEEELTRRAEALAGLSLGELAGQLGGVAPPDLRRAKGWVGQLLEHALGATAGSRAAPDFEALGIELKTLPIARDRRPAESTFVCTIELSRIGEVEWESSLVKKKLSRVLWVPVEGDRALSVSARRIGTPFLWSASREDEANLRADWDELVGIIGRGDVESITGHIGRFLQVRPKAKSSRSRRRGIDVDGTPFAVLPRGFYLRPAFTAQLLRQRFG